MFLLTNFSSCTCDQTPINDNSILVDFESPASLVAEDAGGIDIVMRLNKAAETAVKASFRINAQTAGHGSDFNLDQSRELTIDAGNTSGLIHFDIFEDMDEEQEESLVLTIVQTSGAQPGSNTTHTLAIADNDGPSSSITHINVTPADDLNAVIQAAPDYSVINLAAGVYNLTGHIPYDHGIWIGDRNGLKITGQGWQQTKIKLPSDLDIGLYIYSNVNNLTIEKLHIEGTLPLAINTHAIGNYTETTNVQNVHFRDLRVSDIAVGISIGSGADSTYRNVEVSRNMVSDTVGTDSGSGYGIVCGNSTNVVIQRNFVMNTTRHGIYFGRSALGANNYISGNFVYEHDRFTAHPLRVASAMPVARSSDIAVLNNVILNSHIYSLSVEADDTLGWPVVDISLVNNQILGAYDTAVWISTGNTHTALGNTVTRQPGNMYPEYEYTNGSGFLQIPDSRWQDNDYYFDFIDNFADYYFVIRNGILDRIDPFSWEYASSSENWQQAVSLTSTDNSAGNGRLIVGVGSDLVYEINPETLASRIIATDGSHLVKISAVSQTGPWIADGLTEYRLDVYADSTHLPDKSFFLAEWDLEIPDFVTLTRTELPAIADPADYFYNIAMNNMLSRLDSTAALPPGSTAAALELDDNVRIAGDVFSGASNRNGLLATYYFTVNIDALPQTGSFHFNQVTFASSDMKALTLENGVVAASAQVSVALP